MYSPALHLWDWPAPAESVHCSPLDWCIPWPQIPSLQQHNILPVITFLEQVLQSTTSVSFRGSELLAAVVNHFITIIVKSELLIIVTGYKISLLIIFSIIICLLMKCVYFTEHLHANGACLPFSNLPGLMSIPIILPAPAFLQPIIVASPTAPKPHTAHVDSGSTWKHNHNTYSKCCLVCYKHSYYSGPSLSGHSQQRPPLLIRPLILSATTVNVFTSPFTRVHLSNVAQHLSN